MRYIKGLIGEIYEIKYGLRGGLKPPLGFSPFEKPTHRAKLSYFWCYKMWRIESAIYNWTGLPEKWKEWRDSVR